MKNLILTVFLLIYVSLPAEISRYQYQYIPFLNQYNQKRIIIRSFENNANPYYLILNPFSMETTIKRADSLKIKKISDQWINDTEYYALLQKQQKSKYKYNNGLRSSSVKGVYLSIDLCPTSKKLNKDFFEQIINSRNKRYPVQVNVCVSGRWIERHLDDFEWLKNLDSKVIKICWVNHSFDHPYHSGIEPFRNFFHLKTVDFEQDLIKMEKLLITNGITPTVYYRFPGLISGKNEMKILSKYSLISVGADAWLAKDEYVRPGSIILTHGNGNELSGVKKCLEFLRKNPGIKLYNLKKLQG